MDKDGLKSMKSLYFGCNIIVTTKHQKSRAISPSFFNTLNAHVNECVLDTDQLGTFCGDIERSGSAIECAKRKCEWGINVTKASYGLASEGSFGPSPFIPFIPCGKEIIYFIDKKRDFNLYVQELSHETNYQMAEVSSYSEALEFAKKALFPSHALIIRSSNRDSKGLIFKGLQDTKNLEKCFENALKNSSTRKVWIETDMRAHLNPTRMKVIEQLSEQLAQRLLCLCKRCDTPGWGKIAAEKGLQCRLCQSPTDIIKAETFGCAKCSYIETIAVSTLEDRADPMYCCYCNP